MTYINPVGLDTMSLLILRGFKLRVTGAGSEGDKGRGGALCGAGSGGMSSYLGPATCSRSGEAPRQKKREGEGVVGIRARRS